MYSFNWPTEDNQAECRPEIYRDGIHAVRCHHSCSSNRASRIWGTSVSRRSLRPTVWPETSFRWAKSTALTTSPTQHVRPPGFCHRWSVRLEQWSGPCPQSELHRSCFQTPAKDIFVRTILAHPVGGLEAYRTTRRLVNSPTTNF